MPGTMDRRGFLKRGAVMGGAALGAGTLAAPAVLAQSQPLKLKFGNDLPVTHSLNVRLAEAVAAIASETRGAVEITLFPNNQLGSDSDMMAQLRSGGLEMATMPGVVLSTLIAATSLTGLGFVFSSYDKIWPAMDGDIGNYIRGAIAKTSLVPFQNVWDNGFRQITSSTRPIRTPDDLKNFKIRVPVVPLWVSMFGALGASPTSIPLSEAYSALQTRITDGQENPLALIDTAKFYEVQKFCSLTSHAWDGFWLLANGRTWRAIPAELQAVLEKHFNAAALRQRVDSQKANAELQASLESKGLTFNTADPDVFRQALGRTNFYKEWRGKFGEEAWTMLEKAAGSIG